MVEGHSPHSPQVTTRTTRTPAFWDTPHRPMITHKFEILQETLHTTHLLKLLDKMYKYEMDPTRTVGATEQTRDAGRTDGRTEWNQYTPQQLRCVGGMIRWLDCIHGHQWPQSGELINTQNILMASLIAGFMGPTWGPSGADKTQVGPMLAPWTLLSGLVQNFGNFSMLASILLVHTE